MRVEQKGRRFSYLFVPRAGRVLEGSAKVDIGGETVRPLFLCPDQVYPHLKCSTSIACTGLFERAHAQHLPD